MAGRLGGFALPIFQILEVQDSRGHFGASEGGGAHAGMSVFFELAMDMNMIGDRGKIHARTANSRSS